MNGLTGKAAAAENPAPVERRWSIAFGDVVGVEGAFGVDAVGAVSLPGSSPGGHHRAPVAGK
ncbi:hypothetical protein A5673_14965 [Mycobacterium sp. E3198]|nr:hypothetical protein A5673_14965 [Mycobacterium sp. E3198]